MLFSMQVRERTLRPPRRLPVSAPAFRGRVFPRSAVTQRAVRTVQRALYGEKRSVLTEARGWICDVLLTFLLLILLLTSSFILLGLSLQAGSYATSASTRIPVRINLQRTAPTAAVQQLLSALLRFAPVQSLTYLTKEKQFEQLLHEHPERASFAVAFLPENPLQDRVEVTLRSPKSLSLLQRFLEHPALQLVLAPTFPWALDAWEDAVRSEMVIFRSLQRVFMALAFITLLGVFLVSLEATQRGKRKHSEEHRLHLILGAPQNLCLRSACSLELGALFLLACIPAVVFSFLVMQIFSRIFPWGVS